MDPMQATMIAELSKLDAGRIAELEDVYDVPFIPLPDGAELVSDGQGLFDVWRNGLPEHFALRLEEARTLL